MRTRPRVTTAGRFMQTLSETKRRVIGKLGQFLWALLEVALEISGRVDQALLEQFIACARISAA